MPVCPPEKLPKIRNQAWKNHLSATVPQPPQPPQPGALMKVRSLRSCSPKVNATGPFPADDNLSVPAMSASPEPDRRSCGHRGSLQAAGRRQGQRLPDRGCSPRPTHRDGAAVLGAVGRVETRGRGRRGGCRGGGGRRSRGGGRGRGGWLPVLAGALGFGLDAALVQGEGVLALELQALGRHGLVAGLAGAMVAPAQLDAPAEALHDRAVPRQRELRHGAGGQHHGPRAARAGPGAGLSGPAGTAGSAPRRRPGRLTAAPWPRGLRSELPRGSGSFSGPVRPDPGRRSLPTSGFGLSPPARPHCFPRRRRRHLKIVFRALGRGRGPGRRPPRHG